MSPLGDKSSLQEDIARRYLVLIDKVSLWDRPSVSVHFLIQIHNSRFIVFRLKFTLLLRLSPFRTLLQYVCLTTSNVCRFTTSCRSLSYKRSSGNSRRLKALLFHSTKESASNSLWVKKVGIEPPTLSHICAKQLMFTRVWPPIVAQCEFVLWFSRKSYYICKSLVHVLVSGAKC